MSDFDPHALADGLWRRLRDVILVSERIDTFAFGPDSGPDGSAPRLRLDEADADSVAVDFVLRALRIACDRTNFLLLEAASGEDGADAATLAAALELPALAVSERVGELLQAGLAARSLDSVRVYATEAGLQAVALVRGAAERLASSALRARGADGSPDELPVL